MRAVILAGGKGTRLQPFTVTFPKPLMPLGDIPVVEVLVRRLVEYGISDVILTLGHLADLIRAYFDRRQQLCSQLSLHYVQEDEPTGTAGSLSFVEGLDQTFLVMNGDLLTDLDFDGLVAFHRHAGAALTIATHARTIKIDLGVLEIGSDAQLVGYREKPELQYKVSMGVYVYEPRVLSYIEYGKYLDFPDLVLKLLAAGEKVVAWPWEGLWLDIGRPDDYARAQALFAERPNSFLADAPELV
jgi:NDP-sugar pyrophosphorylase family protein